MKLSTETSAMTRPLEVPVFSPSSAHTAIRLGASRIEYNASGSYPEGGLTPKNLADLGGFSSSGIPIRIMIRPRGPPDAPEPDFIYSDQEVTLMKEDILGFRESKLLNADRGDGFVFGILKSSQVGHLIVDMERNKSLVQLARPYRCVFHRAFDDLIGSLSGTAGSWEQALEDVIACGFDAILTSGGPGRAPDNIKVVKEVIAAANGRIEIIVGGGVRSQNVRDIAESIGDSKGAWFHSSCLTSSSGAEVDEGEVQNILRELEQ